MSVAETVWTFGVWVAIALVAATALVSIYTWAHAYLTEIGPRFSFRTLLIAMTLIAVLLSWAIFSASTIFKAVWY